MGNSLLKNDGDKPLIPVKIAVIGDTEVGKTAIIQRYVRDTFIQNQHESIDNDQKVPDINLKSKIHPLSECNINMQFYDLCTEHNQTVSSLLSTIINEARVVVFTFDLMRKESLKSIKKWYNESRKLDKKFIPIIVGNKYDLFKNMNDLYKLEIIKLSREYSNKMHCPFIMTSAKSSTNIKSLFTLIIEYMFQMKFTLKQQKERHEPILEWNEYEGHPRNLLHPTVHIEKLIEINENKKRKKLNNDMIESDHENDGMDDMIYPQQYIYHSGDNFDEEDVKEVEQFLNETRKEFVDDAVEEGSEGNDDDDDEEKIELRQGVVLMEKGSVTNNDAEVQDEEKQKAETLMGFVRETEYECDDEGDEDEDEIMMHKSMTLMGGNLTMKDENESDDEKVIESGNVTMIGLCQNEKLKFIQ